MPISQRKYVDITSGIGGASAAARKDLILRLFTTNPLFPVNQVLEFNSVEEIGAFLGGSSSVDYKIASAYLGWVSKVATKARKISFMRYSKDAVAPFIRSTQNLPTVATFNTIANGSIKVTMGGVTASLTGLDFTSASTYADVANVLQTAIQGYTAGGELFTSATIQYLPTPACFILTGGVEGNAEIAYCEATGSGTDVSAMFGFGVAQSPVLSNGFNEATITDVLNETIQVSNNFASFAFVNETLTESIIEEIGSWCDAQNFQYMFVGDVSPNNYVVLAPVAAKHSGVCINYNPYSGNQNYLPAYLMPASILAATDYTKLNGTVNYMYQQFDNQEVAVSTDAMAKTLDDLNINYNGQTQKSGAKIEFYQDGFMANGTDITVYANEIWLKDAMATEILNLEIGLNKIPANETGLALVEGILQAVIEEAKTNGTISLGKELTNTQKAYITQLTGDNEAWKVIYNLGFILSVELSQTVTNGTTRYIAEYTLIYSKGDVIRKVEGNHILI